MNKAKVYCISIKNRCYLVQNPVSTFVPSLTLPRLSPLNHLHSLTLTLTHLSLFLTLPPPPSTYVDLVLAHLDLPYSIIQAVLSLEWKYPHGDHDDDDYDL